MSKLFSCLLRAVAAGATTTDRSMKGWGIRYILELSNLGNRLGKELGGKHFRSFHFYYCIRGSADVEKQSTLLLPVTVTGCIADKTWILIRVTK